MNKYAIKCKSCKKGDVVTIDKQNRIYWQNNDHIISGRLRLDQKWGWQCRCGNNSLLTEQENTYITDKVNPDPKEIEAIVSNLQPDNKIKFEMEKL